MHLKHLLICELSIAVIVDKKLKCRATCNFMDVSAGDVKTIACIIVKKAVGVEIIDRLLVLLACILLTRCSHFQHFL